MAVEGAAGEGVDDLFDFGGDDVAVDEIGVVEDRAEEAFGEQVLHEHFVDGLVVQVGVERLAANAGEAVKSGDETLILAVFFFDDVEQVAREFGDTRFELQHCCLEAFDVRLGVSEELLQCILHVVDAGHVEVKDFAFALVEHGAARVLEDGVGERVVLLDLVGDLFVEVAFRPLGLPVAAPQVVGVAHDAIGPDAAFDGLFVYQRPADLARPIRQQVMEGRAQGQFMTCLAFILVQLFVVPANGFSERGGVECG